MSLPLIHSVARLCQAPAEQAFRHLTGVKGMARWCLGMFETRELEPGLMTGRSLFSGAQVYARLACDQPQLRVDYSVGASSETLLPWIHAQVTRGPDLGYDTGHCLVALWANRPQSMADGNWERVMRTHETEIDLITQQLEADAAGLRA